MSADSYAICPRCAHAEELRIADLKARVNAEYGVLPIAEFDALCAEASVAIDLEKLTTFREDYEFYGAEDGVVNVSYSGHCSVCDCGIDFSDQRPFYSKDPI